MSKSVVVRRPEGLPSPVIATIPHGGTHIPGSFARGMRVDQDTLWSDWHTSDLYRFLPQIGITVVEAALSVFVANVNRSPWGPIFGPYWKAVVPSTTPWEQRVYDIDLKPDELEERLAVAYWPFHQALDEAVAALLEIHPRILLLDLHSFGMPKADIVLGDARGTTCRTEAVHLVADAFRGRGLETALNDTFTGGWIVRRFKGRHEIDAIQVEVNQRVYLDPEEIDAIVQPPTLNAVRLVQAQGSFREAFEEILHRFDPSCDES